MATLWTIYLVISVIAAISVLAYILLSKRFLLIIKLAAIILSIFIASLVYNQYIVYKSEKSFPKIKEIKDKLVIPFESESHIKEYLNVINKDRPIIIAVPLIVRIHFSDPVSPKSPHAIFYILFKNEGRKKAVEVNIKWNIIDNGNKITPPDEWNKIIGKEESSITFDPGQTMQYLYGPEIGAYAVSSIPKIDLSLTIDYRDEDGKKYSYYCRSKTNSNQQPHNSYLFDILEVK